MNLFSFLGLVASRLVLIWVIMTTLTQPQNPENFKKEVVSLVSKFYPNLIISRSIEFIDIISVDSSKNIQFKLYYTSAGLADAGFFLFSDQYFQFYDSRVLKFIERGLLQIYLNKGKSVQHENVKYKLKGKEINTPALYSNMEKGLLSGFTGFEIKSISNGKKKFYTALLTCKQGILEVSFPARVDLILGASWEELSTELTNRISETQKSDYLNPFLSKYFDQIKTPLIEKREAHRSGIFEDVLDTSFSFGNSALYYSKDTNVYRKVDAAKEPVEHLNNILIGLDSVALAPVTVALKVKNYGAKFSETKVPMNYLLRELLSGSHLFLAFEEYKGRKIVNLFFPDKILNSFHLFYFEVEEFSLAKIQNKVLKGWLYPYLRLDNLNDIDKEFDGQGKPKWRVPVGQ